MLPSTPSRINRSVRKTKNPPAKEAAIGNPTSDTKLRKSIRPTPYAMYLYKKGEPIRLPFSVTFRFFNLEAKRQTNDAVDITEVAVKVVLEICLDACFTKVNVWYIGCTKNCAFKSISTQADEVRTIIDGKIGFSPDRKTFDWSVSKGWGSLRLCYELRPVLFLGGTIPKYLCS